VRVGGIGLHVFISGRTLASLPAPGETVRLHTHLYVREEVLSLYGFTEAAELSMFELLLTVSGVGPRLGLAILSTAPPERLAQEIANGDDALLLRVSGVGRRTAARLILELKNKVDVVPLPMGPDDGELVEALTSLGYSVTEAQMVIRALPQGESLTLEDQLRRALAQLAPQSG